MRKKVRDVIEEVLPYMQVAVTGSLERDMARLHGRSCT